MPRTAALHWRLWVSTRPLRRPPESRTMRRRATSLQLGVDNQRSDGHSAWNATHAILLDALYALLHLRGRQIDIIDPDAGHRRSKTAGREYLDAQIVFQICRVSGEVKGQE